MAQATIDNAGLYLKLNQLHESKANPRRHFAGLEELTASVKQHGVLTPLLVRKNSGGYEIIAGARRYRAAKAVGIESLPVRILDLDDAQALEFQVIENLQREDIHPLDEALGYQALLKAGKHDIASVAARVNKSESYIYQRLKLTALIPEAQKQFLSDKITAGHALLIARLQPSEQKQALAQCREGDVSVRRLADYVEREILIKLSNAPWKLDDETLLPSAGSCVACPKRTGANPKLFPDVKAKDTCTDPGCFNDKLEAQVKRNTAAGLVSISTSGVYGREKRIPGVVYDGHYRSGTELDCKHAKDAVVVIAASYSGVRVGHSTKVCMDAKCGTGNFGSEVSRMSKAEKAKQKRLRAIGEGRTEAVRQISAAVKWPLTEDRARLAASAFLSRMTFDSQKLLCKALGIWPKDGKTGGFDFRGKAKAHLASLDKNGLAGFLVAAAAVPEWGRWGGGYGGDREEVARLNAAASGTGVSVKKLERAQLKAKKAVRP